MGGEIEAVKVYGKIGRYMQSNITSPAISSPDQSVSLLHTHFACFGHLQRALSQLNLPANTQKARLLKD